MKVNGIDLVQVMTQIRQLLMTIASFAIAFVLLGSIAKATGHAVPYLPALDPTQMAYLGVGYWASR